MSSYDIRDITFNMFARASAAIACIDRVAPTRHLIADPLIARARDMLNFVASTMIAPAMIMAFRGGKVDTRSIDIAEKIINDVVDILNDVVQMLPEDKAVDISTCINILMYRSYTETPPIQ